VACHESIPRNTGTLKKRPRLGRRQQSHPIAPDARLRKTAKTTLETAKVMAGASKGQLSCYGVWWCEEVVACGE